MFAKRLHQQAQATGTATQMLSTQTDILPTAFFSAPLSHRSPGKQGVPDAGRTNGSRADVQGTFHPGRHTKGFVVVDVGIHSAVVSTQQVNGVPSTVPLA